MFTSGSSDSSHPADSMPQHALFAALRSQGTLSAAVSTRGIGVHSGEPVMLVLRPAPVDHGIVFQRTDIDPAVGRVRAHWDQVTDTRLCTVIANDHGTSVATIEHLLAALRACGIDNAMVELDGPEVPILDGSAAQWVALIDRVGVVAQPARRREIVVERALRIDDGERWAMLLPAPVPRFTVNIDFADAVVGQQRYDVVLDEARFREEIAAARTFGFMRDIRALQATGRTLGGSLDNAVVIDDGRVLNPGGLRFPDEFVRHKLLDCVGDLYLAGGPIIGHLIASRPGHALNAMLVRALHASPAAWRWSTEAPRLAPKADAATLAA